MKGTNANTGKPLDGLRHLAQSILDILTTPIGSRVMRREYGSRLPRLVDAPMNRATILDIYAATAEAIARWEPRFALETVTASSAQPGAIVLDLTGEYLPDGQTVTIKGFAIGAKPEAAAGGNQLSKVVIANELAIVLGK